ncbi:protein synthesis inhibitor II-like [Lolium rigidum]|uniref:protein synthesis inhibitor II-like n=1 Tax=Lolium rigidum TaxID=89674 RepID=UPI001F5C4724|nr:protein synthesis inhibitor II-like [Lolium rigidum]
MTQCIVPLLGGDIEVLILIKLVGVLLGPQQMTEAVNALAARTGADLGSGAKQQQARDAVVALLLMVNEATRFQTVSAFVAGLMHPKAAAKRGTITNEMKAQVNGWQDLSRALLQTDRCDVDKPEGKGKGQEESAAEKKPPPIRPRPGAFQASDQMDVKTAHKAAATVGILLFVQVPGGMDETKALQMFRASVNY